ncbi:MAG: phosphomethylpyrimidine kinase [Frankiales bacterium]|nr:phosphomethylpyrimidine kinase [Frankiales bacterium]
MKRVLVIGGSDSGGGAGIQADLKTLQALGVHGCTVLTAVTAQSSTAVLDIHDVPSASVRAQLAAVLDDIGADVVKTGMLASAEAVAVVAEAVGDLPLVVDPVGISSTGRSLLNAEGLALLRSALLPLATVVTPNLAEVEALTGVVVHDEGDLLSAAQAVHALGPRWVLVKGGHLPGRPVDLLYDGSVATALEGPRVDTPHTHGTGCTLASALAAQLALGHDVPEAAAKAKDFVTQAIMNGYPLGKGPGPVRQA